MDRAEATGKNVNEAIEHALLQLGKSRDDVDIQVLREGSRGILGIGAEDARVVATVKGPPQHQRVTPPPPQETSTQSPPQPAGQRRMTITLPGQARRQPAAAPVETISVPPAPPVSRATPQAVPAVDHQPSAPPVPAFAAVPTAEAFDVPDEHTLAEGDEAGTVAVVTPGQEPPDQETVDTTVEIVEELLRLMNIEAETEVRSLDFPLTINITGEDLGILIGRRGDTLGALQFMVNLMVGRKMKRWVKVVVDVEDYRLRREHALRDLAGKAADRVRRLRQSVTLEAMPPNERRIVHLTLQGDRFVSTHSVGGGDERRVVISPRPR